MTIPATTHRPTGKATAHNSESEDVHARARHGILRCAALLLRAISRDWQHCGKTACLRSRRCRGFACEPAWKGAQRGADLRGTAGKAKRSIEAAE